MITDVFTVSPRGVGRRDYSQQTEFASVPSFRGYQYRDYLTAVYELPTLIYPSVYAAVVEFFDETGAVVQAAPESPYFIYDIRLTGHSNALVYLAIYRFLTYEDIWIWNPDKNYGTTWGYGIAEHAISKGIKTVEGDYYAFLFAQYTEEPTFTVDCMFHMLNDRVEYAG